MEVRKDGEFYPVHANMPDGSRETYLVNAKYDRVDFFTELGHCILKVYTDEDGFIGLHVSEEEGFSVAMNADLPIVIRDFMFESEYNGYLNHQTASMDDNWLEMEIQDATED